MNSSPETPGTPEPRDHVTDPWLAPVEDTWAWAYEDEGEEDVDLSGFVVTAVLVTRNAEPWLEETLAGLALLEPRPHRLVVVDNASTDATPRMLATAQRAGTVDVVIDGAAGDGFGRAVQRALSHLASDPGDGGPNAWLWLLHDDGIVTPGVLAELLRHAAGDPDLRVTGPKLLRPRQVRGARARGSAGLPHLSEVGVSIAGTGRRELSLEPGEMDQGQHDEPREVLGVSTCGLLVRRDVWDGLGGLTESLPVFRDGVDLGWRAWLAGHKVMTTPTATIVHRQVGHAGLRAASACGEHPARVDRALGLHVIAGHARGARRPLVWLRLIGVCLLRALGYLLGKAPGRSVDELIALGSFLRHPGRTRAIRAGVRAVDPDLERVRAAERLRPPWWSGLAVGLNRAGSALADREVDRRSRRGDDHALEHSPDHSLDALTGDEFAGTVTRAPRWRSATLATFVVTVVLALVAGRSLWRAGSLVAPALLPAGPGFWARWLDPIPGSAVSAPPWLGLIALALSVLRPEPVATVLVCAMVPLGFVAAQPLLRAMTTDRRVRWWAGAAWAVLPAVLGGENQARIALGVLAVALPLLGVAIGRLARRAGLRGAWSTGLALAVVTAFVPILIAPAVLALIVAAVILLLGPWGRSDRAGTLRLLGRCGIAVAVPVVLWAPWWVTLVASGAFGRVLYGPDPSLLSATATGVPDTWWLLLGRAGGDGLPPLWISAVVVGAVWAAAVVALALVPTRRAVLGGWLAALSGFAVAVVVSRAVLPVPPLDLSSRPWVGGLLLAALGGLLVAAAAGLPALGGVLAGRSFGVAQALAALLSVVVALAVMSGAGWYAAFGAAGPVHRQQFTALPPYVRDAQRDDGTRTLAITVNGADVGWSLIEDDQLRLGDAERGYAFGGSAAAMTLTDDVTRRLVGGSADEDIAPDLTRLGVQYVWLSGADRAQQTVIGATPGLAVASGTAGAQIWRVEQPTGRVLIVSGGAPSSGSSASSVTPVRPDGAHQPLRGAARVPAGAPDRVLVLTEPADDRWQVTLDGVPLQPAAPGAAATTWQQTYRLGAGGGRLEWRLAAGRHVPVLAIAQGVAVLVMIVLALPALRPETRHPTRAARRAAVVARGQP